MARFKDEAEAGLYGQFHAYLQLKHPDILKIALESGTSELHKGVDQGLKVAFDLFQAYTEAFKDKFAKTAAKLADTDEEAREQYARMLKECYPHIFEETLNSGNIKTANFSGVAFDLFLALVEQGKQLQSLQDENKRIIETFFIQRSAHNE